MGTKPHSTKPQRIELELGTKGFTWKAGRKLEDGSYSHRPKLSITAVMSDQPVDAMMDFLAHARGMFWVRVTCGDLPAWEGLGDIGSVKWKPAEAGEDTHPTVEIPLSFEENDKTNVLEFLKLRLQMDDLGQPRADFVLQVWQEDLPFD